MFWTAVVAGLIAAVRSGEQDLGTMVFITDVYLAVVCGIATLILHPRAIDAYISICGTILLLAVMFLTVSLLPEGIREYVGGCLFFCSIPLGIYSLYLILKINYLLDQPRPRFPCPAAQCRVGFSDYSDSPPVGLPFFAGFFPVTSAYP